MKYTKAMIEVIDLVAEDVVLTSGSGDPTCPVKTERDKD